MELNTWTVWRVLIGLVLHSFEIGFDVVLLIHFHLEGDIFWFFYTLTILLLPNLVICISHYFVFLRHDTSLSASDIFVNIIIDLIGGHYILSAYHVITGTNKDVQYKWNNIININKIIEAICESIPMCFLKSYVLLYYMSLHPKGWLDPTDAYHVIFSVSLFFSFMSVSFAITGMDETLIKSLEFFLVLWFYCVQVALKVLAISWFAFLWKEYAVMYVGMDLIFTGAFLMGQKKYFQKSGIDAKGFELAMNVLVSVFVPCHISYKKRESGFKYMLGFSLLKNIPLLVLSMIENFKQWVLVSSSLLTPIIPLWWYLTDRYRSSIVNQAIPLKATARTTRTPSTKKAVSLQIDGQEDIQDFNYDTPDGQEVYYNEEEEDFVDPDEIGNRN